MPEITETDILFTFQVEGQPPDLFAVVRFDGHEAMSELYRFDIDLVSSNSDIDSDAIVNHSAVLMVERDGDVRHFHGIVSRFSEGDRGPEFVQYSVVLSPRLINLMHPVQCQIFQEKDIKTIISDVLIENGLADGDDFVIRAPGTYPTHEYVAQYQQSDLDFIMQRAEHDGLYFFFDHGENKEQLIIADNKDAYLDVHGETTIPYRDARSVNPGGEAVGSFWLNQQLVPKNVILKDYNYRKPSLEIKGEAEIHESGFGTFMEYGDHFKDPEDGKRLAAVRAEEILCRRRTFNGSSGWRHLECGHKFTLEDHFKPTMNGEYVITSVTHSGSQLGIVGSASGGTPDRPSYTNQFTCIASDLLFRPARVTPKPKVFGFMHAVIDAGGSGEYAEIDEDGRYKVKLPFDLSDASEGKASKFVRMAQPYSGPGMGMHFPLHKGTEVLLIHLDGDPDRPLIVGSVPNPDTISPVTGANQTQCVIHSGGNNRIVIEDTDGTQRIAMTSPTASTYFSIGAPPE